VERKSRLNEYDQVLNQHPMLQQHKKGSMWGALTGVKLDNPEETKVKKAKRITSPELWELSRLRYNSRLVDLEDEF
jgi:ATP-dependent RNA helicase DHX8/PRP22